MKFILSALLLTFSLSSFANCDSYKAQIIANFEVVEETTNGCLVAVTSITSYNSFSEHSFCALSKYDVKSSLIEVSSSQCESSYLSGVLYTEGDSILLEK